MKQWLDLLQTVMTDGESRADRTGVGTKALFGTQIVMRNDEDQFPAVTTKKLFVDQCFAEMACLIHGFDNLEDFHKYGCTIWDANAAQTTGSSFKPRRPGDLGRIYGVQWRYWRTLNGGYVDQLATLVQDLQNNPTSRRHLVTNWNPGELHEMVLPPCHYTFQCYVSNKKHLDLMVQMRSVDLFLGLPFDIAGYALLQRLIAQTCNLKSRRLIFSLGDAHVYKNHTVQVATVLGRNPLKPPRLVLDPAATIYNFHPTMAELYGYRHLGAVKAEMAT